ncbi:hypothetical protein ADUPG1_007778 [Aduncisulcus paluster]|uniref:RING-type domain-containing protein n=1 Tax=Aduncisulcus paluster TaxID=2918883 RepID=A0ABQ5KPG9_9EUKA|nr:hypothetical protein ADUPG1_007778 [Aduncisulcus paluster]
MSEHSFLGDEGEMTSSRSPGASHDILHDDERDQVHTEDVELIGGTATSELSFKEKCDKVLAKMITFSETPVNQALCQCPKKYDLYQCPICYSLLCSQDSYLKIGCGHCFHKDCLKKWAETHRDCPVCRSQLNSALLQIEGGLLLDKEKNVIRLSSVMFNRLKMKGDGTKFPTTSFTVMELGEELLIWVQGRKEFKLEGVRPTSHVFLREPPFLPSSSSSSLIYPGGGRLSDILQFYNDEHITIADIHNSVGITIGKFLLEACKLVESRPGTDVRLRRISPKDIFISYKVCVWLSGTQLLPPEVVKEIQDGKEQTDIAILARPVEKVSEEEEEKGEKEKEKDTKVNEEEEEEKYSSDLYALDLGKYHEEIEIGQGIVEIMKLFGLDVSDLEPVLISPSKPSSSSSSSSSSFSSSSSTSIETNRESIEQFLMSLADSSTSPGAQALAIDNALDGLPECDDWEGLTAGSFHTLQDARNATAAAHEAEVAPPVGPNGFIEELGWNNIMGPLHDTSETIPPIEDGDAAITRFIKKFILTPLNIGFVRRNVKDTLIEYIMASVLFLTLGVFFFYIVIKEIQYNSVWSYPVEGSYLFSITSFAVKYRWWLWSVGCVFTVGNLVQIAYKRLNNFTLIGSFTKVFIFLGEKLVWLIAIVLGWLGALGCSFSNDWKHGNFMYFSFFGPIRVAIQCIFNLINLGLCALCLKLHTSTPVNMLVTVSTHIIFSYVAHIFIYVSIGTHISNNDNWNWWYEYHQWCIYYLSPLYESVCTTLRRLLDSQDEYNAVFPDFFACSSIMLNMSAYYFYHYILMDILCVFIPPLFILSAFAD